MIKILERIEEDLKKAMKGKALIKVSTLRFLKSKIHNAEIASRWEKKKEEFEEGDVLKIISKEISRHKDSIEEFKKGEREDLVKKETHELEILSSYMPDQMTEVEILKIVTKKISEIGAQGKKDFGKVMKEIMAQIKGKVDGKLVSKLVNNKLSKLEKPEDV